MPAPNADPSTAARPAWRVFQIARITRCARWSRSRARSAGMRSIVEMSPPEQNTGPAPVSTMARTDIAIAVGGLDRLCESDAQRDVDRVALLRPVERDCATAAIVVDKHWAGGRGGHRPVNLGERRSMTARSPSNASAVPESSETVRDSSASRCSTEAPTPFHTSRLVADSGQGRRARQSGGDFFVRGAIIHRRAQPR